MLVARVSVSRAEIGVRRFGPITAGMVGARVEVEFDSTWDDYTKTFVWSHNGVTIDDLGATGTIPTEVLEKSGGMLTFGVYGTKDDTVLPTLWAVIGGVHAGADPSGDESADPTLPVWAQLQEDVEQLRQENGESVDPETVKQLVNEYLEENPPAGGTDGVGITSIDIEEV